MRFLKLSATAFATACLVTMACGTAFAQDAVRPHAELLILDKHDNSLVVVDPANQNVLGRVPAGTDPHEVVASPDGKFAYISNYGGPGSGLHTLSVVDLVAMKALPPIDLGALHSAHGLTFAGGKVYFTAETNKVIGHYDPATGQVDWVLGVGQDRTHMIVVSRDLTKIFTSNVNSATVAIIEQVMRQDGPPPGLNPSGAGPGVGAGAGPGGPPPGDPPRMKQDWEVTAISVGKGAEGFDVSPDEREMWVANAQDGTISIVDVSAKKVTRTIDAHINFANRLKFTPDGKQVLVSSLGSGDLVIYDAARRKEVKRLKLGRGAAGILMAPDGSRAYVACSPDDNVAIIDLRTLEVVGRIVSGKDPDGLAWVIAQP